MDERNTLLKNLSAIGFYLFDLHLFLNTHPNETRAMELYSRYRQQFLALTAEFESKFGPLTALNGVSGNEWKWVRSPWPWEYSGNTEV
jgi:spore coat protein JB